MEETVCVDVLILVVVAVPPNYTYLPEASFLRAIVDLLLEAGKQGQKCE